MDFVPSSKANDFTVGRLEGEAFAGVYLSSAFVGRLAEIHDAAQKRLAQSSSDSPDAVRNLMGVLARLIGTYATAVRPDREAQDEAHSQEVWNALMRAKSILDDMGKR
ncbi:MAG TPA: hypothetical protein VH814_12045 [Steroidobacteraceae bacterium]|jgi:hypothetical protein